MDDLVAKALRAAHQHFADGGFLSALLSGPDYQSTGDKTVADGTVNWGDPQSAADFFRADKAMRLAQQAQGADVPLPPRRPVDLPESAVESAPSLRVNPNPSPEMKALLERTATEEPAIPANVVAMSPDKTAERAAPEATKISDRAAPDQSIADAVWSRMIQQESGGRQFDRSGRTLTSPTGALGISQVQPQTGPEAARLAGLPWSLNRLATDTDYNHALGRAYFDAQLSRFGDPVLAAAAYNGGPGRVAQALRQAQATGRPYTDFLRPETRHYIGVVNPQARADGGEVDAPDGVDQALDVVRQQPDSGDVYGNPVTGETMPTDQGMQPSAFTKALGSDLDRAVENAKRLAMIPQQVYTGERQFDPQNLSDEDVSDIMGLAGFAGTGGIGGVKAAAGDTVLGSGPVRVSPSTSIEHEGSGIFRVFHGSEPAGTISVAKNGAGNFVSAANLDEPFIGKGIGHEAYNLIEKEIGRKLAPSPLGISPTASKFWQKRLKEMSPEDQAELFAKTREAGSSYGLPERDVNLRLFGISGVDALPPIKRADGGSVVDRALMLVSKQA